LWGKLLKKDLLEKLWKAAQLSRPRAREKVFGCFREGNQNLAEGLANKRKTVRGKQLERKENCRRRKGLES